MLLFVGDVVVLYVSLWATLSLRALEFPTASVWQTYTVPFTILIVVWLFVFFIFYHIVRFGVGTQPKIGSAIFVLGSLVLFFMSVTFFSIINWADIINKLS